jgi:uncharacterized protein (TIGR04255 family)
MGAMMLDLPTAAEAVSTRSSVTMAICQVRFEQQPAISTGPTAAAFHGSVGGADGPYPSIDQVEGASRTVMGVGPGGPISETTRTNGWRLASADEGWSLVLLPDNMGLQTEEGYEGWDDYAERLSNALAALAEVASPTFEQRLGLRLVDRLRCGELGVDSPAGWEAYIAPPFLGPLLQPGLASAIKGVHQQLVIDPGGGVTCNMRHGLALVQEKGGCDYVIDCDFFREGGRAFDVEAILKAVTDFKDQADRLFQASVTPALLGKI